MKFRIRVFIFSLMLVLNLLLPAEAGPKSIKEKSAPSASARMKAKPGIPARLVGQRFSAMKPPATSSQGASAGSTSPSARGLTAYQMVSEDQRDFNTHLDGKSLINEYHAIVDGLKIGFAVDNLLALTFIPFEEPELEKILEPIRRLAKIGNFKFDTHYVRNAYGLSEKDPELKAQGDAEAIALSEKITGKTLAVGIFAIYKPIEFFQRDFGSQFLIASLDYKSKKDNPMIRKSKRGN